MRELTDPEEIARRERLWKIRSFLQIRMALASHAKIYQEKAAELRALYPAKHLGTVYEPTDVGTPDRDVWLLPAIAQARGAEGCLATVEAELLEDYGIDCQKLSADYWDQAIDDAEFEDEGDSDDDTPLT